MRGSNPTRRSFLQKAAGASAWCMGLNRTVAWAAPEPEASVRAWATSDTQKLAEFPVGPWREGPGQSGAAIHLDRTTSYQSVLGFGGAFTDASCWLFSRMPAPQRQELLEDLFGPNGLRLSMGRIPMGASDYSRSIYSYDDSTSPDPELKHFSIDHDREYILPTLQAAASINPEMFYFSTPWSPPGWMKTGRSMLGGCIHKDHFPAYAQYFVKFIQAYGAAGVHVRAVTSQNEVDTDQDGRMPAAVWGQEYETGFVSQFLGPAFEAAGIDTRIWILDHNYDLWGRVLDELSDPAVSRYVEGVAWHGYLGKPDAMTRVHDAFPSKSAYWTEGGPDITAPDYATDWARWGGTFCGVFRNWARCAVSWNFLLDQNGEPNTGPFHCGGMVTLDARSQEIRRSGQYWALGHFSRYVRRGAKVIASTGSLPGLDHVAFLNPDGSRVLVIANSGAASEATCVADNRHLSLSLPANSVVTLQWD